MRTDALETVSRGRRGVTLVITLLLLTLLISIVAQLATRTSVAEVILHRRSNRLHHELAVDSVLLLLADRLTESNPDWPEMIQELDQRCNVEFSLALGDVEVHCQLDDDGAKFNPRLFQEDAERTRLERKVSMLGTRYPLPPARVALKPLLLPTRGYNRYRWFDQLFDGVEAGGLCRVEPTDDPVWSDGISFWGDGRVDLRRVSPVVLEALLEDVQPGLAQSVLAARPQKPVDNFLEVALRPVPAELRQQVASRLSYDVRRYALEIETTLAADRRRWYVVAEIREGRVSVLHRSKITW